MTSQVRFFPPSVTQVSSTNMHNILFVAILSDISNFQAPCALGIYSYEYKVG